MAMNAAQIESVVRDVIVHLGLPFTVVSVLDSPTGWNVVVRSGAGGTIQIAVGSGRPAAMRATIEEALEAAD